MIFFYQKNNHQTLKFNLMLAILKSNKHIKPLNLCLIIF